MQVFGDPRYSLGIAFTSLSVATDSAVVTVFGPPTVTTNPLPIADAVLTGTSVSFSAGGTTVAGTLSYVRDPTTAGCMLH